MKGIYVSLAHYNNFQKSHCECENRYPYTKLLKKSLQLRKKVVVFMDDNYILSSFSCGVRRGPYNYQM